jgi:hypothetical protein
VELILNGGFEQAQAGNPNLPQDWTPDTLVSGDKQICNTPGNIKAYEGECAFQFKFEGDTNVTRQIIQSVTVPPAMKAGDILVFSVHAKAKDLTPTGAVLVTITYADGNNDQVKFDLPAGTYDYILFTQPLTVSGNVTSIKAKARVKGGSGSMIIDAVSLLWTSTSGLIPNAENTGGGIIPLPLPPSISLP